MKNAQMIAKYAFDVKLKIRLSSLADASAPTVKEPQEIHMISPLEAIPNRIFSFSHVTLLATLAFVDCEGSFYEVDGFDGETLNEPAVSISEGAIWALTSGRNAGNIVQFFPASKWESGKRNLKVFAGVDPEHPPSTIVAQYEGGVCGALRATDHATNRVQSSIDAFHDLVHMSDRMLEHALETNLEGAISYAQHIENVQMLEEYIQSNGDVADEIRAFLAKIHSRNDRKKRRNVYRMVLIVRAVQRRAKEIAEEKTETLKAVAQIKMDVARYIGAITDMASRIATELEDHHSWQSGDAGMLSPSVSQRRLQNWINQLMQYKTLLAEVHAHPFRRWAIRASAHIGNMIAGYANGQYSHILDNSRSAVAALRAILVREQISLAISTGRKGDKTRVQESMIDIFSWARDLSPRLGMAGSVATLLNQAWQLNDGNDWEAAEDQLHEIEREFDRLRPEKIAA